MLGSYAWVIQAGRYRMRLLDLPGAILEEVRHRPVENARATRAKSCRVLPRSHTCPGRFNTDQVNGFVGIERVEHAHRVRSPTDAGHGVVGQAAFLLQYLPASFPADHRLEIANHHRIGMRPDD